MRIAECLEVVFSNRYAGIMSGFEYHNAKTTPLPAQGLRNYLHAGPIRGDTYATRRAIWSIVPVH